MTGDDLSQRKAELRAALRAVRIDPQDRARASVAITAAVKQHAAWQVDAVAAFVGVRHEPDTRLLLAEVLAAGKTLWLPRVHDKTRLSWSAVEDLDTLRPGAYGLFEPPPGQLHFPEVGVALVPGLAFGSDGARLGQGRGYYDRALAAAGSCRRLGLCLAAFLDPAQGAVPVGPEDVRMDAVITERSLTP